MARPASTFFKIHKIAQAHLAPGMNLVKWRAILSDYIYHTADLDALTPIQVDEIIKRISAEVAATKKDNHNDRQQDDRQ